MNTPSVSSVRNNARLLRKIFTWGTILFIYIGFGLLSFLRVKEQANLDWNQFIYDLAIMVGAVIVGMILIMFYSMHEKRYKVQKDCEAQVDTNGNRTKFTTKEQIDRDDVYVHNKKLNDDIQMHEHEENMVEKTKQYRKVIMSNISKYNFKRKKNIWFFVKSRKMKFENLLQMWKDELALIEKYQVFLNHLALFEYEEAEALRKELTSVDNFDVDSIRVKYLPIYYSQIYSGVTLGSDGRQVVANNAADVADLLTFKILTIVFFSSVIFYFGLEVLEEMDRYAWFIFVYRILALSYSIYTANDIGSGELYDRREGLFKNRLQWSSRFINRMKRKYTDIDSR